MTSQTKQKIITTNIFHKSETSTVELCRIHWNLMNDEDFGSFKYLKVKCRKGNQIIQSFSRIRSPQVIRFPLFNLRKFLKIEKSAAESCRINWNLLDDKEFGSFKFLKLKYRRRRGEGGAQIIQPFWRIGSCQEIRFSLFNIRKFKKTEKSTSESCRMHSNLMNDKEFGSLKL